MMMEGKDKPVDFFRVLEHIKAVSPYPEEDPMDEEMIVSSAQELLDGLEGPSKEFKQVKLDKIGFQTGYGKDFF